METYRSWDKKPSDNILELPRFVVETNHQKENAFIDLINKENTYTMSEISINNLIKPITDIENDSATNLIKHFNDIKGMITVSNKSDGEIGEPFFAAFCGNTV